MTIIAVYKNEKVRKLADDLTAEAVLLIEDLNAKTEEDLYGVKGEVPKDPKMK